MCLDHLQAICHKHTGTFDAHGLRTHLYKKKLISQAHLQAGECRTSFPPLSSLQTFRFCPVGRMAGPTTGGSQGPSSPLCGVSPFMHRRAEALPRGLCCRPSSRHLSPSVLELGGSSCTRLLLHPLGWGNCTRGGHCTDCANSICLEKEKSHLVLFNRDSQSVVLSFPS